MLDTPGISFAAKGIEDLAIRHQIDVNPLTGAAVISVPLPLTPGRSGFGPSLALEYTSSAPNSVYGVGWSLAGLSTIGLSSKQLPEYNGKDRFAFNGTEDLVPVLQEDGDHWEPRVEESGYFWVHFYRAKVERTYTRFEKWVHQDTGRVHWRSRDENGVVSVYGFRNSGDSRVSDPADPDRTYLWLVEAQYDSNGNAILYEYAPENADNVNVSQSFERHRVLNGAGFAQRYLKWIRYGNTEPLDEPLSADAPVPATAEWLFGVVFDFGDHEDAPLPPHSPNRAWPCRPDPYSTFRPGFEVRTYRLCQRILMFHHFAELGSEPALVGAVELEHLRDAAGSTLQAVHYTGFRRDPDTGQVSQRSLPPIQFEYSLPRMGPGFQAAPEQTKENFPNGLSDARYRWVDLFGEGLPGILAETNQAWYYKPNYGGGNFGPQQKVAEKPSHRLGSYALTDFDRDGNPNLVVLQGRQAGFYEYDRDTNQWRSFEPFSSAPHLDAVDTKAQWLDLNGDGLPDVMVSRQDRFTWYPSVGKEGFGAPIEFAKPYPNGTSQVQAIAENLDLETFFADMSGDGLLDQVCIQNGRVEYWPQIGNGRFGDGVLMEDAPVFDFDTQFDAGRLRLVDLDGSGTTDLLYIGRGEIHYWINASGNRFVEGGRLTGLPYIDNLSTVSVLDFLGDGTPCLVWSSALLSYAHTPMHYLQLTDGVNPRLLLSVDNSMGKEVRLTYASSGSHYLRDKNEGRGWISKLPSHTTVVDEMEVIDHIGESRFVSRYEYHDGYFDGEERVFRGFGLVDQYDSEVFSSASTVPEEDYTAPACIRIWYHTGAPDWEGRRRQHHYRGDADQVLLPTHTFEEPASLDGEEYDDGIRALAGQVTRQEVFACSADGVRAEHPYQVTQTSYHLRCLQPSRGEDDACFAFYQSEVLSYDYEQHPEDPRVAHQLTLDVDPHGNVLEECAVAYPRRESIPTDVAAQRRHYLSAACYTYLNIDEPDRYELAIPIESKAFELAGLVPEIGEIFRLDRLKAALDTALVAPLDFHEALDPVATSAQARLVTWDRSYYWNDDLTTPLPHGQVGQRTLLHHEESACFSEALIDEVFESLFEPSLLQTDGRYELRDGYWWQPGPVQHYLPAAEFFLLSWEERLDGGATHYAYDAPYYLTLVQVRDGLDNRIQAEIDYHLLAPHRITDPNDNLAEVLYDPLGVIAVSTAQGSVLGPAGSAELYGNELLSAYTIQPHADFAMVLAEPARFLQNASQFLCYKLDGWEAPGSPPRSISLVREEFVHDGRGGGAPESRIQTTVAYSDGFGRPLQTKLRAEGGPAISRDDSGAIVEEVVSERWLVSGHTVYNNKQLPVRQYEPFYSPTVAFESDAELRAHGVSTHSHYDAVGRLIRQDMPNGTFTRVETTPWEVRSYDPNDTILEGAASSYRGVRESLPDDDPEKQALDKAQAHADTPTIVHLDPLGREVLQIETDNDGADRVTTSELDIQGNVTAIIDPRGLTAFSYRRDMLGRVLHEHSVDAGDGWSLPDALYRPVHQWDARGVHRDLSYDTLGRPTSVYVDGALGLDQVVERMEYGDAPSFADAELRNARGRLVTHYDQAGVVTIHQYDPAGNPMRSERQLLADYKAEPNWGDPEAVVLDDSGPFVTETTYDALGRVTEQRLPDSTARSIRYLQSGGVGRVGVTTADGALDDTPFLSDSSFNARGQRTRSVLGNKVEITYGYDPETFRLNHVTSTRPPAAPSGSPQTLQDIAYTYDPVGNIVHFVDHAQQPVPAPAHVLQGLQVSSHCEFTYDAFYQLTDASGRVHQALEQHDYRFGHQHREIPELLKGTHHISLNNGEAVERYTRTYDYDLSGNIQSIRHTPLAHPERGWTTEMWTSPTSNRSLPAEGPSGLPVTDPETRFDPNGNCTFMPHLRALDWNYRNNISRAVLIDRSAEGQPNDVEYYVYGGDGMRVRKVTERLVNGQLDVTEKSYLDGCEIKRVRRNGDLLLERTTSHVTDGANRIALLHQWTEDRWARETDDTSQKKTHYQLSDHLGSSSLELDEHGVVISYEGYFPYGGTAFLAGNDVREVKLKTYRYCGKERDDSTGFYYYGYRYYAPWIGNWLSPDPIGPDDSLNLYQFVLNNPINLVDPNGLHCGRCGRPPSVVGRSTSRHPAVVAAREARIRRATEEMLAEREAVESERRLLREAEGEAIQSARESCEQSASTSCTCVITSGPTIVYENSDDPIGTIQVDTYCIPEETVPSEVQEEPEQRGRPRPRAQEMETPEESIGEEPAAEDLESNANDISIESGELPNVEEESTPLIIDIKPYEDKDPADLPTMTYSGSSSSRATKPRASGVREIDWGTVASEAATTIAIGAGILGVFVLASAAGVGVGTLFFIGAVAYGYFGATSAISRAEEAYQAGYTDVGARALVIGFLDPTGIPSFAEGVTGREAVTERLLVSEEADIRLGRGIGGVTVALGGLAAGSYAPIRTRISSTASSVVRRTPLRTYSPEHWEGLAVEMARAAELERMVTIEVNAYTHRSVGAAAANPHGGYIVIRNMPSRGYRIVQPRPGLRFMNRGRLTARARELHQFLPEQPQPGIEVTRGQVAIGIVLAEEASTGAPIYIVGSSSGKVPTIIQQQLQPNEIAAIGRAGIHGEMNAYCYAVEQLNAVPRAAAANIAMCEDCAIAMLSNSVVVEGWVRVPIKE